METYMQRMDNTQTNGAVVDAQLTGTSMPSTDRLSLFNRITRAAVMAFALAGNPDGTHAQSPTTTPPTPNPAAAQQPEANGLAAGRAVNTKPCDVTVLENRLFCVSQEGTIVTLNHPELQVPKQGDSGIGQPSLGACFHVIVEGVAEIKRRNDNMIPEGYEVWVELQDSRRPNRPQTFRVDPKFIPSIEGLSKQAFDNAKRDPLTKRALEGLQRNLALKVENLGDGLTMTFVDRSGNEGIRLLVGLLKASRCSARRHEIFALTRGACYRFN